MSTSSSLAASRGGRSFADADAGDRFVADAVAAARARYEAARAANRAKLGLDAPAAPPPEPLIVRRPRPSRAKAPVRHTLTPEAWKLSPCEETLLRLLTLREWPDAAALGAAFEAAPGGGARSSVTVFLSNLRWKLRPFGIVVPERAKGWAVRGGAPIEMVRLSDAQRAACAPLFEQRP